MAPKATAVRRISAAIMITAILLPAGFGPVQAAAPVEREWIVSLAPGGDIGARARALTKEVGRSPKHIYTKALTGFSFRGSEQAAARLASKAGVRQVVRSDPVALVAESTPTGVRRIDARHPTAVDAHEAGFRGVGVSIAILDTGVDLDHPDLAANIDAARGKNCMGAGPPEDGHGHGSHVAGTAAGVADNGIGIVGVAPSARIVPVKVLDDTGNGTTATVVCGIDHLVALRQDGDPANDVLVANMSLGETGGAGNCSDGAMRQAICTAVGAGITFVVAAGNSTVDADTFYPANFPEVITVSASMDTDGEPGGLGGCTFFGLFCDDQLAFFSNFGASVDVTAPGVGVQSTWKDGGYGSSDGTSMASPHAAGVAALVVGARAGLSPADVRAILIAGGECPDGTWVNTDGDHDCVGQGQRGGDTDGIAEPYINALRSAQLTATYDPLPIVSITSPADGATVSGIVPIVATATDNTRVDRVVFAVDGAALSTDTNPADGWTASWESTGSTNGLHAVIATAFDDLGQSAVDTNTVRIGPPPGDWVGARGSSGWMLAAWNDQTDRGSLPNATLQVTQGARWLWGVFGDVRALEREDEGERRAAAWYDNTELRLRLDFNAAFTGDLHLYAIDWDNQGRRERITVDDGSIQTVDLASSFVDGTWVTVPISVGSGESVHVTVTKTGGLTAVLSGLFLGGPGAPPPIGPPPTGNGDWVAVRGADGYDLLAWNDSTDLVGMQGRTVALLQGARWSWGVSTELRALENPDETQRRATAWYHSTELKARIDFPTAYTGNLHLYVIDWDDQGRRQRMTVDDGRGPQVADLTSPYVGGTWVTFPIQVSGGGSVAITATKTAGLTAVMSGIFLGDAGGPTPTPTPTATPTPAPTPTPTPTATPTPTPTATPPTTPTPAPSPTPTPTPPPTPTPTPPPTPTPTPTPPGPGPESQGDWVGTVGRDGYILGAWNETGDLRSAAGPALTINQGSRWIYGTSTSLRALENEAETQRRAAAWYHSTELRLRLTFTDAYSGDLHIYAIDWDSQNRRERIVVNDGTTSTTVDLANSFVDGAWLHVPINVPAGGVVTITATKTGGLTAVISGLFLGGPGAPPAPPVPGSELQGDWVGRLGSRGYALAAWNNNSDRLRMPQVALAITQGTRYRWASSTTSLRALENEAETQRRAAAWYHSTELRLRLTFTDAYSGDLHIYAIDWDSQNRRERIVVNDGTTSTTVDLANSFVDGAWLHVPINVPAGGVVTITATKTGGLTAVISGLFLGGPGAPP